MPQRPRSHVLEDISTNKFEALLPEHWVVRRKGNDHDYGTDLEVEIFDDSGQATGFLFNVQIRATDDIRKRQKLKLTVDQINYYRSMDLLTAVVRYCDIDGSFHWQWHPNIIAETNLKEHQKTFTKTFSDKEIWTENSYKEILSTLKTRRLIDTYSSEWPINLTVDLTGLAFNDQYIVEAAVDRLVESFPSLINAYQDHRFLSIWITGKKNEMAIGIDCISSFSLNFDSFELREIESSILYCVTALLKQHRISTQAEKFGLELVKRRLPHFSRELAYKACLSMSNNLEVSAELAILNGLHEQQDEFCALFNVFLMRSRPQNEDRKKAIEKFYDAELQAARTVSKSTEAAVHYSISNFFRVNGEFASAIKHMNRAKKLRPEYKDTAYFLIELGGCCFNTQHYSWAAIVYDRVQQLNATHLVGLYLADALLFSGKVVAAKEQFEYALTSDEQFLKHQALAKIILCEWMIDRYKKDILPVDGGNKRTPQNTEGTTLTDWENTLEHEDVFDGVANFNLGVTFAKDGNHSDALGFFLVCCFKSAGDIESWANAMICAHQIGSAELLITIMAVSIYLGGRKSYDAYRSLLVEQSAHPDLVESMDKLARELMVLIRSKNSDGITFRILDDEGYQEIALD